MCVCVFASSFVYSKVMEGRGKGEREGGRKKREGREEKERLKWRMILHS